jgi:hypothetical protein
MNQESKPELITKCPCGHELRFRIKKPVSFGLEIVKAQCSDCLSTFLVKVKVGKNRKIDIDIGVQNITPKCKAIIKGILDDRKKKAAQSDVSGGAPGTIEGPGGPETA